MGVAGYELWAELRAEHTTHRDRVNIHPAMNIFDITLYLH